MFSRSSLIVGAVALLAVLPKAGAEEDASSDSSTTDGGSSSEDDFSAAALFIGFREALEACVIISVMLNMLDKTGNAHLKRWVWIGAGAGLILSIIIGSALVGAWYAVKSQALSDEGMYAIEGVFSAIASIFLSYIAITFLRFADLEKKWTEKLFKSGEAEQENQDKGFVGNIKAKYGIHSQAINTQDLVVAGQKFGGIEASPENPAGTSSEDDSGSGSGSSGIETVSHWTIIVLCFSAVFREGLETFLFLGAVGKGTDPTGLATGGCVGIVLGCLFGVAVLYIGKSIGNLQWFFISTTVFILFIAAGLAMYGMHEFEEIEAKDAKARNDPIIMRPLWDLSSGLPDGSGMGAFFRALVGYQDKPTFLEAIVYLVYWLIIVSLFLIKYKNGTLFSKYSGKESSSSEQFDTKQADLVNVKSTIVESGGYNAQPVNVSMQSSVTMPGFYIPQGQAAYGQPGYAGQPVMLPAGTYPQLGAQGPLPPMPPAPPVMMGQA
mmetsp:Transcript_31072/g.48662  ORF Transcript_31072/g.48662 Transcript_31072/m.48662 type:complete len:494 (-) Transcript_31072:140-1621(-)|eukprot:CAMPEP_0184310244 /NCGR_PEP_ID=MMETSP1049-20130417/26708_1 /TAXON_ID=77928 /ORGANISM="Proteomonas sulcata, Strain CCMP704" /LENGTH=493 /DNA_ID=CAMNT_0026624067 /DNA_START=126 /DNA_END=1607 /DNA_ORIENTATION=+